MSVIVVGYQYNTMIAYLTLALRPPLPQVSGLLQGARNDTEKAELPLHSPSVAAARVHD